MDTNSIRPFTSSLLALALLAAGPLLAGAPDCSGISGVYNTDPILDGELTTIRLAQGLDNPVLVTASPGDNDRLFVVEQTGAIRLLKNGVLQTDPFIDLDPIVSGGTSGERGLLGLAFDPDYQNNRFFYVYYTTVAGGGAGTGDIVVARYERDIADPDLGDDSTGQILVSIPHSISNHNGGGIAFGPDGFLYIGTGDGGASCDPGPFPGNAQTTTTLLGKMLRIDPFGTTGGNPDCEGIGGNYKIPAGNPFADGAGGDCDEIWAYGLRNPWRWSFDRVTDSLYIGDVGQNQREELDCNVGNGAGANYGWNAYEGNNCDTCNEWAAACPITLPDYVPPIHTYSLAGAPCAITGGYVYRGCRMADLDGIYFYSDACDPFINTFPTSASCQMGAELNRELDLDPPGAVSISSIVSFGEDNRGELYIVDYNGEIFKIVPNLNIMEVSGPNATELLIDAAGGFSWEDLQATSDIRLRYFKVYRADTFTPGSGPGPFECIQKQLSGSTSWTGDTDTPASGQVFHYLVTAQDAALTETTAGAASDGTLRVVDPDESGCPL